MAIAQRHPAAAKITSRPILDLLLLVALGAVAGTVLVTATDTAWLDGIASAVPDLHSNVAANRAMVGVTRFGEEAVLLAAFAGATLLALRRRGPVWGRFFAVVGAGALTIDNLIKPLVGRSRPAFDQLVGGRGESFPSGHVTATIALLLAIAWYAGHGRRTAVRRALWFSAAGGGIAMAVLARLPRGPLAHRRCGRPAPRGGLDVDGGPIAARCRGIPISDDTPQPPGARSPGSGEPGPVRSRMQPVYRQ